MCFSCGSREGALGAMSPLPPRFKVMQFSGNCKGKTPYFEQILGSGPPLGSKFYWAPLTKILDPRLCFPDPGFRLIWTHMSCAVHSGDVNTAWNSLQDVMDGAPWRCWCWWGRCVFCSLRFNLRYKHLYQETWKIRIGQQTHLVGVNSCSCTLSVIFALYVYM